MPDHIYPLLFAVFVWWFSTGVIIYLDGLPRRTFRWSMAGATVLLGVGLYGLAHSAALTTPGAAYLAFGSGLLVWGWNETAFLMGFVAGPRREPCPPACRGWQRFGDAVLTILYHELAILVTAGAVIALTWNGPNQVGVWTFMILWIMRLSAKLNVFLGVPNLAEAFLPDHLGYLKSYFTRRPMNPLFPVSVTSATAVAALLVQVVVASDASAFEVAGGTLLATLLALAIMEHWFMVLPLPDEALWRWALDARDWARNPQGIRALVGWPTDARTGRLRRPPTLGGPNLPCPATADGRGVSAGVGDLGPRLAPSTPRRHP